MKTTTPKWLSTTLSFVLLGLILAAYFVTHVPRRAVSPIETVSYAFPITNHPAFTNDLGIGAVTIKVADAVTPAEQNLGLSNTVPLTEKEGMLFVFPEATKPAFWMKDMNYPLDLIWIGPSRTVVDISPNLLPSSYPQTFTPKESAEYVLEVPAGFAEKNNITIGTMAFTSNNG